MTRCTVVFGSVPINTPKLYEWDAEQLIFKYWRVNMDWGSKENRIAVVVLHKCSKTRMEIFALLKPFNIKKKFVRRAINRYNELCSVNDRPRSGHSHTAQIPAAVKAVVKWICRNLLPKQKIMAKEMQIPQRTMPRIIRHDLGLWAYQWCTRQFLTSALCRIRATIAKWLLTQHVKGGHRQILFTDEKIFSVQEKFNK